MDLGAVKDAFDRVTKKQKLSSAKSQELTDQVCREIERAVLTMQLSSDGLGISDQKSILTGVRSKLTEMALIDQLEESQKELNIVVSKYGKILEKHLNPDISKAYRMVDFDSRTVNQIIACHLYRQGLFDLGDSFVREAHEPDDVVVFRSKFVEMFQILDAMRSRHLEPALVWATRERKQLLQSGSGLELKLRRWQFVEILQKGSRNEALKYARSYLAPFASLHKVEIQKLMACLLWVGRLDQCPYAELMSANHWEKLAEELTQQFCALLAQSCKSPLSVVITAGVQVLPTLLKMVTVAAKKQDWQTMKQLPFPIDLGREFQFHSLFVCPVAREVGSKENPPMLMPCGHVVSYLAITKLSKSSTRHFKCPSCPSEATVAQCKELHF